MQNKPLPAVVVMAQTPPPFHGQSVMQQYLVDEQWSWCNKSHIRLDYSDDVSQIGRFSFRKVTRLFSILRLLRKQTSAAKADLIYYPPAGPNRIPLYRDVITIWVARRRGKKIVLHFHAGGLDELIKKMSAPEKWLIKKGFSNIDYAIVLLPRLIPEVSWFSPRQTFVLPNGIKDEAVENISRKKQGDDIVFLFVGNLTEKKGIFILLEAARICREKGLSFRLHIMGAAHSADIQANIETMIRTYALGDRVCMLGSLSGKAKWEVFAAADVFCLPTFATEAMPVSILEAMMYSLPVISTHWRAIPDIIDEGVQGFLVPIGDPISLAGKMIYFITHPEKIMEMGQRGRLKYSQEFNVNLHLHRMENLIKNCTA